MSSSPPTVRRISWPAIIPQLLLVALLTLVYTYAGIGLPFFFAALTYSFIAMMLKKTIAKDHRQGIRFVMQKQYPAAIPYFEKSIAFFERNKWIDEYRFITLMSASSMRYREMGLCNLAFCYSQMGDGEKAILFYQRVLSEYPDNDLAVAGLNMLTSTNPSRDQTVPPLT
ncbi:MAG: hypothetical protein JWQ27_364 [Ferruginibacter sp.]|nr:hypothetical protein [Ferruginibacter sp.]